MSATNSLFRFPTCAALAASVLTASALARGQTTTASALFQEAKELMNAGSYDRACPKLQEAQRLYPTAGTLLTLGDCLEHAGKLASSWGAFKEAEVMARNAKDADREREAQRRSGVLAPKLARLAIIVPPAARVAGFELRRDGAVVGEAQWGSPLPIDVGAHTLEASAPGRKPWSTVLRIETNGSTASVEAQVLEVNPDSAPAPAVPFWGTQRVAGTVVVGAGLVGMVVGGIFAAKASSKNSDSLPHCLPNDITACDAAGVALRNEAFDAAKVSTIMFVASGITAAAGIVIFATAPKQKSGSATAVWLMPVVGPSSAGLSVHGAW